MKLTTLFLALVLATGSAWAEWVKVLDVKDFTYYAEARSPTSQGIIRPVQEMIGLTETDKTGSKSYVGKYEYDCNGARFRLISLAAYATFMASGAPTRIDEINSGWADVPQKTARAVLFMRACGIS